MLRVVAEFTAACDYTHCLMIPGMNLLTVRGTAFCCLAAVFRVPRQLLLGFGCFLKGSPGTAAGCTLTYVVTCPGSTWCFGVIARGPPSAPPLCVGTLTLCPYCVYLLFISWPFCNYTTACDCTKQRRTAPNSLFISWSHCVWYLQSPPPLPTHPLFISPSENTCKVLY